MKRRSGFDFGKKMLLIGGAALFLLYSLNCFVILPVRNMLANDVIFASNLLVSNIFNVLSQLAEVVAISVFYATLFLFPYVWRLESRL